MPNLQVQQNDDETSGRIKGFLTSQFLFHIKQFFISTKESIEVQLH